MNRSINLSISFFIFIINYCCRDVFSFSLNQSKKTAIGRKEHFATIIGEWDENEFNSNSFPSIFNDERQSNNPLQQIYSVIAYNLSHNQDKLASLARLAVAFSPPQQALRLNQINHIDVIEVTNDHIELSAVVCDESECVTLFVPVQFPHLCSNNDYEEATEECVFDNILELDMEAQEVIKKMDVEQEFFNSQGGKELIYALHSSADIDSSLEFPSWWIHPNNKEMIKECRHMKNILNQETFQMQVKSIASEGLSFCTDGELFEIQKAVVSAICPSGFYFRAIACRKSQGYDAKNQYTIIDIPYAMFQINNGVIDDPAALRSAVLGAFAAIDGQ